MNERESNGCRKTKRERERERERERDREITENAVEASRARRRDADSSVLSSRFSPPPFPGGITTSRNGDALSRGRAV